MNPSICSFEKTMDLLVKAYFNDTLQHEWCTACAVGNICRRDAHWYLIFGMYGSPNQMRQYISNNSWSINPNAPSYLYDETSTLFKKIKARRKALKLIASTGYTVNELARVEFAFETAPKGESADDWMFNGLLAVLEILADIHKVDFSGQMIYERQLAEIHSTK